MKKLILFIVILMLFSLTYADLALAYIGFEEGQLMVGLEATRSQVDQNTGNEGDVGIDIRQYFHKEGIMVGDVEYGAINTKTAVTLGLGGIAKEGNVLAFAHTLEFLPSSEYEDNIQHHSIWENGYVQGGSPLTSFAPRRAGSSCH